MRCCILGYESFGGYDQKKHENCVEMNFYSQIETAQNVLRWSKKKLREANCGWLDMPCV